MCYPDPAAQAVGSHAAIERADNWRVTRVELLQTQMTEPYARLTRRLAGLTDDEFFWEPVRGCWTVHQDASGRWTYDYEIPDPSPPPVTTIGWRLVHISHCKIMYHEWSYGPARLTFPDLPTPSTAAHAIAQLEEGQTLLRSDLEGLSDGELDKLRLTNWGEKWPAWRIFWTMMDHDAQHGAEIGCLRDLYRATMGR
jgi:hypothetical protein